MATNNSLTHSPTYIDLAEAHRQLLEKERYLQVINDFAVAILQQTTVDEIVWAVAQNAVGKLGLEDCIVYLLNESGTTLVQQAAYGPKNPAAYEIKDPIIIPLGQGIVGTVAQTGVAEVIPDTRQDTRYILDDAFRLSEITVPIIYDDQVIGVIDSEHSEAHFFTETHLRTLITIAAMASTKIVNALTMERLIAANAALKKAGRIKDEFLAMMSHELRTPLTAIIGYAEILDIQIKESLNNKQQRALNNILQSGQHLLAMIESLFDIAKIETGQLTLEKTAVSIAPLCTTSLSLIQRQARQKNHTLTSNHEIFKDVTLQADKTRLQQIILNLLDNAVKYTPAGGSIELKIGTDLMAKQLSIAIQDSGIGIATADQESIFQPFIQLTNATTSRPLEGAGLGLALVHRLVALHEGSIAVESKQNQGSRFTITLPWGPA